MRFEHVYDELGRRIETTIDDSEWYPTPAPGTLDFRPPDRISRILYDYRPNGQLDSVLAWRQTFSGEAIVAQNYFAYDEHDNLTQEYQLHAGPLEAYGHVVDYAWSYSPDPGAGGGGYNFNRLASITYPAWCNTTGQGPTGGGRRTVTSHYGNDAGDVDSALGRVTRIEDSELGDVASFSYMGLSRRIGRTWGPAAAAIVSLALLDPAAAGLDRFGCVSDLHFTLGPAAGAAEGQTVHRYQYGYDLAGNRTYARVTHADTPAGAWGNGQPPSVTPHINDRSWLYAYDGLHRLVDARMGSLSDDNDAILTGGTSLPGGGTAPVPRSTQWFLDNLGNWSAGDVPGPGLPPESVIRSEDTDGDGTAETFTLHHDVDLRNRLTQITADGTDARAMVQDPAGNLVSDGVYFFEYDAFNRLVQVSEVGTLEFHPDDGRVVDGAAGDLVARYQYDGLGRLIAKTTPIVEGVVSGQYQPTLLQRKDFYYDGVRRIQEVITRYYAPLLSSANDELPGTGGEGEGEGEGEPEPGPAPLIWTDREYIYGPDDVDEYVAQFDREARPMLVVQDGNLNVVALLAGTDDVFFDAGTNALPAGSVLEQYVYDPYGAVVFQESFAEHAVNRVGHQGLFFDRFDGDWENAGLAPGAVGLYYNRNRFYSPPSLRNVGDAQNPDWRIVGLGRFISADPNETALTLVSALAMNGQPFGGPEGTAFSLLGHYRDGLNLYSYARNNPLSYRDALGTFSLSELGTAMFTQSLIGALFGGAVSKATGGGFWNGAISGGVSGALGGGAGYAVNAYAASLSGLIGTIGAHATVGAADGFASGLGGSLAMGNDFWTAASDAMFAAAVGGVTGGLLDWPMNRLAMRMGFKTGDAARDFMQFLVGGRAEVYIAQAKRTIDVVSQRVGYEVKMGAQSLNQRLRDQIRKDAEILANRHGGIESIEWHFFRSANTGKIGPNPALRAELDKAGIRIVIHE